MGERFPVRIIWVGGRPARKVVRQTREELADLLNTGLGHPSDLCFHTVLLTDDFEGPSVFCWGKRHRRSFFAEYDAKTEWTPLAARPDEKGE